MIFKKAIFFTFFIFTLISCSEAKDSRTILGKSVAERQLKSVLKENSEPQNNIDNKTVIIKDSQTAINIAEPILFSIYGKENIIEQKPYEIYLIDNFWIISGTLPKEYFGGTFLIIMDARNAEILKITHGK